MKLKTQYAKIFFERINKDIGSSKHVGKKLRTYAKITFYYHLDEYIMCGTKLNFKKNHNANKLGSQIAKLRKSADVNQNLQRRKTFLLFFLKIKAQDKVHFIVDCPAFTETQEELISLSSEQRFVRIFKSWEKSTMLILGLFIEKAFSAQTELYNRNLQ